MKRQLAIGLVGMLSSYTPLAAAQAPTAAAPAATQAVLGPGLYVFQTRVDSSSCGDAERTGYVTSFYAAVNGVPGSLSMDMKLLNSAYWSTWTLEVSADGVVIGDSLQDGKTGPDRGESHFTVKQDGKRFKGKGVRSYAATIDGKPQRCRVAYDALLVRIDG